MSKKILLLLTALLLALVLSGCGAIVIEDPDPVYIGRSLSALFT